MSKHLETETNQKNMARKITEEALKEEATIPMQPKKKKKYLFKVIIFLIIIGLSGATVYYYKQYKKIKNNPQVVSEEETKAIISEVGKLMELPEGTPSLATVQDKEKLKDQSFFRKAENGDKVLIYTDAKQAILFRPSAKKIIEVAPLILSGNEENNTGMTQENKTVKNNQEQKNPEENQ